MSNIENRNRCINALKALEDADSPKDWEKVGGLAIRGLIGFGFSKSKPHIALVVTNSGRSLVDCNTSEKISRDYAEYEGLDDSFIYCKGINEIEHETILLSSVYGGGIPTTTNKGDSLFLEAPYWPQKTLIFCEDSAHPLIGDGKNKCVKIKNTGDVELFGFSWCGNYFAYADFCDFHIWRRIL